LILDDFSANSTEDHQLSAVMTSTLMALSKKNAAESTGLSWFTRNGKRLHNELARSTMLLMAKSTISMAMFNSYI